MSLLAAIHASSFAGAIGAGAAAWFSSWILAKVRATPPLVRDGVTYLRYHSLYAVVGWMGCLAFTGFIVGVDLSAELPKIKMLCLSVFGFFSLFSLLLVLIWQRCRLAYTDSFLVYSPLWGRPARFEWGDIQKVTYSRTAQWWVLHLRQGRKARLSIYMNGVLDFMAILHQRSSVDIPTVVLPNGPIR